MESLSSEILQNKLDKTLSNLIKCCSSRCFEKEVELEPSRDMLQTKLFNYFVFMFLTFFFNMVV